MQKPINIKLDTLTKQTIVDCSNIRRGDNILLTLSMYQNGVELNVTDQEIHLILTKSDGTVIERIGTGDGNIASIGLDEQATMCLGVVKGEIELSDAKGVSISNIFTYIVDESLVTNVIKKSIDQIKTLVDINNLLVDYNENAENLATQNINATTNITNLSSENDKATTNTPELTTENANAANNISELTGLNSNAATLKTALETDTAAGNTLKTDLESATLEANTVKNNLDNSNTQASANISELNIQNTNANANISNLGTENTNATNNISTLQSSEFATEIQTARGSQISLGARLNANDALIATNITNIATNATTIASLASGSPKGTYSTVSALTTAYPSGNTNVYVVTADGGWYYWNSSVWTKGGTYQSTGFANNSVTPEKTSFFSADISKNLFNYSAALIGYTLSSSGTVSVSASWLVSDFIDVSNNVGKTLYFSTNGVGAGCQKIIALGPDKATVLGSSDWALTYVIPVGTSYIRFSASTNFKPDTKAQLEYNAITSYANYYVNYYFNGALLDNSIATHHIADKNITENKLDNNLENKVAAIDNLAWRNNSEKDVISFGTKLLQFSDYTATNCVTDTTVKKLAPSTLKANATSSARVDFVINQKFIFNPTDIIGLLLYTDRVTYGTASNGLSGQINLLFYTGPNCTGTYEEMYTDSFGLSSGWQLLKIQRQNFNNYNSSNGNTFQSVHVYTPSQPTWFDTLLLNPIQKPKIILNFDTSPDHALNIVKPLLDQYGFTGTVGYSDTSTNGVNNMKTLLDAGWDYGFRLTTSNTTYDTILADWQTQVSSLNAVGFRVPIVLLAENGEITVDKENIAKKLGFKLGRGGLCEFMNYFDSDCFTSSVYMINKDKLAKTESYIDSAIATGNSLSILCHELTDGSNSSDVVNCPLTIYTSMLDYLKTKVDAGLCEVVTYSQYYNSCVDEGTLYSQHDFNFLQDRVKMLEQKLNSYIAAH